MQRAFEELEEHARTQLEADGLAPDQIVLQRVCDCRYLGQGYELRVDVPSGAIDHDWIEKVRADFHDIHEREYSRRFEESDIELPNVRVRGIGLMPDAPDAGGRARPGVARAGAHARGRGVVPRRRRAETGRHALLRPRAAPGREPAAGPAIVNQYDSTTVIPPGIGAHVDRYGNIVIEVGASAEARQLAAGMEVTA